MRIRPYTKHTNTAGGGGARKMRVPLYYRTRACSVFFMRSVQRQQAKSTKVCMKAKYYIFPVCVKFKCDSGGGGAFGVGVAHTIVSFIFIDSLRVLFKWRYFFGGEVKIASICILIIDLTDTTSGNKCRALIKWYASKTCFAIIAFIYGNMSCILCT